MVHCEDSVHSLSQGRKGAPRVKKLTQYSQSINQPTHPSYYCFVWVITKRMGCTSNQIVQKLVPICAFWVLCLGWTLLLSLVVPSLFFFFPPPPLPPLDGCFFLNRVWQDFNNQRPLLKWVQGFGSYSLEVCQFCCFILDYSTSNRKLGKATPKKKKKIVFMICKIYIQVFLSRLF